VAGYRAQCLSQNFSDAESFPDDSTEFGKHGTPLVRLVVCLTSLDSPGENPSLAKIREFPLNRPGAKADQVDELPLVEALVGMRQQSF
jgi:hypothetical protein